jgi:putative membrane protein
MALFSASQQKAIATAIERVERSTSGELVVVHTARSHDYGFIRSSFAFLLSVLLLDVTHWLHPGLHLSWLLFGQIALAATLYALSGVGPLLRVLVPRSVQAERCLERAVRAMLEQGVIETRDRSGVLIFLSEAEHRVVILADKGINDRVEPGEWDRDVDVLVQALKQGQAADGLLSVVDRIGQLLVQSFPPRADDANELSNAPRQI